MQIPHLYSIIFLRDLKFKAPCRQQWASLAFGKSVCSVYTWQMFPLPFLYPLLPMDPHLLPNPLPRPSALTLPVQVQPLAEKSLNLRHSAFFIYKMEIGIITMSSSLIHLNELDTSQASWLQIHALEKLMDKYNPVQLILQRQSGLDVVGTERSL